VQWLVCGGDAQGPRIFLDCTLGDGGHAEALLQASGKDDRVIGIDRDTDAIEQASARLASFGARFTSMHVAFAAGVRQLAIKKNEKMHGVLADLGVSSRHLNVAERGFSFRQVGPLDMRMDRSQTATAADLVNTTDESQLADLIYLYGEERKSRRIARAICARRASAPFVETTDLAQVVRESVGVRGAVHTGKIDPATRTFQALRIVVNRELEELEQLLDVAPELLAPCGRLAIISYHSLEDRLVKHRFRTLAQTRAGEFSVQTKRPIMPSDTEIEINPRARSAKLRVLARRA